MLELKEAIKKSFEYLDLMYGGQELNNKLLEEIEYDKSSGVWKVVIGFDSNRVTVTDRIDRSSSIGSLLGVPLQSAKEKIKNYKQIRLKGSDGSFVKMLRC